jgi:hypothetical protein
MNWIFEVYSNIYQATAKQRPAAAKPKPQSGRG